MKKILKKIAVIAALLALALSAWAGEAQEPPSPAATKSAVIVPVEGEINNILLLQIRRSLEKAKEFSPDVYIFEINSFGGTVYDSDEIAHEIIELKAELKVSFIRKRAISGGIYVAFASDRIVMQPGSSMGDSQPIFMTPKGIEEAPEKMQSPIRAYFRAQAQRNGWPVALSEALVTPDEVYEVTFENGSRIYVKSNYEGRYLEGSFGGQTFKIATPRIDRDHGENIKKIREMFPGEELACDPEIVVGVGKLLTMTTSESLRYGFASATADTPEDYLRELGRKNGVTYSVHRIENTAWESFCELLISPTMKLVFLVIAVLGIYIELKVPGFGVPGIVGILALAMLLFAHHLFGLAETWEIALVIAGIILLGLEVFIIPGFGVAGIAGVLCIMAGLVLSFQDFVIPSGEFQAEFFKTNLATVMGSFVIFFVLAVILARFLPKSSLFNRLMLVSYQGKRTVTAAENRWKDFSDLVGASGEAKTMLRPAGKAVINDEFLDVVAKGEFLPPGTHVRVIEVQGNRIIVEKSKVPEGDNVPESEGEGS